MTIKLNIGRPIAPAKSLAEQLKVSTAGSVKGIDSPNTPIADTDIGIQSPLKAALNLENNPAIGNGAVTMEVADKFIASTIPQVSNNKYQLLTDSTDTLDEKTLAQFNQRMQYLEVAFDNGELGDAMKRVLEYCQEHQELRPFLRAEDIAIFVLGARNSYARIAESKDKNRNKRSKSAAMDEKVIEDLMDIEIDL